MYVTIMLQAWPPSVCRLSVTSVDCDHVGQRKVEIGTLQDRSSSWLTARWSSPGYNRSPYPVIPIPKFYWGRAVKYGKCGVLHFIGMHPMACMSYYLSIVLRLFLLLHCISLNLVLCVEFPYEIFREPSKVPNAWWVTVNINAIRKSLIFSV